MPSAAANRPFRSFALKRLIRPIPRTALSFPARPLCTSGPPAPSLPATPSGLFPANAVFFSAFPEKPLSRERPAARRKRFHDTGKPAFPAMPAIPFFPEVPPFLRKHPGHGFPFHCPPHRCFQKAPRKKPDRTIPSPTIPAFSFPFLPPQETGHPERPSRVSLFYLPARLSPFSVDNSVYFPFFPFLFNPFSPLPV